MRTDNRRTTLRRATTKDIPAFVQFQLDPDSTYAAAFMPSMTADVLATRWNQILQDATTTNYAILYDGDTAGFASAFFRDDEREVTYWIDRKHWGKGIATAAVVQLLRREATRPLYARVACDNSASIRVLEKAGFGRIAAGFDFAPARDCQIEEFVFRLP